MTTYTKISKPSNTQYSNVNSTGKTQYDQSDISFDDSSMFYDGVNQSLYIKISKPAGTSYIKISKPS